MHTQRKLRITLTLLAPLAAALAPATAALAAPTLYTLTDLGTLGGSTFSNAFSINNTGQITGQSNAVAYLYANGSMTALPSGGGSSAGNAINSAGTVVGWINQRPATFSGGTSHDLGTFGGPNGQALGINTAGQVVGNAAVSGSPPWAHAFLYNGTSLVDLGTLGGDNSSARAINTAGQIVGYAATTNDAATHAFLYAAGHMTDLGTLPGGGASRANDINDAGLIVGAAGATADHPFLYAAGHMTDLGSLGGGSGVANAINLTGTIVGNSLNAAAAQHAFVYTDGTMYDLNALLAPGTPAGYTLTFGADINDSGQIVGSATTPTGQTHGYLLTPVTPEPTSLAACALATLPLIRRRRLA